MSQRSDEQPDWRIPDNGCWKCGNIEGRVLRTAFDEDGNKVRARRCTRCGDVWMTEERRLARGVGWWQRAFSQAEHQRHAYRSQRRTCRYCGGRWQRGTWRTHLLSPTHIAWKRRRLAEIRQQRTEDSRWRYHADPVYRERQIAAATKRARERRAQARAA